MKNTPPVRRVLLAATVAVACLTLGRAALAQGAFPRQSYAAIEISGHVRALDGNPAEGAVVVSSAGGQAVTDARGDYRLEVRVPLGAESVQLTAVGGTGGSLQASRRVPLLASAVNVPVDALELTQPRPCARSWLPTFGGEPGTRGPVLALTVFDDGGGSSLRAGGQFRNCLDSDDSYVAEWGCPDPVGPTSYCAPANANSVSAGGAVLTSVSGFGTSAALFDLSDVPNQPGLLFAGINTPDLPFGCGRRCVGGMTLRGAVTVPSGNQALGVPFDMSPANAVNIQYWYRDPAHLALCGSAFNLSNALKP